MSKLVAAMEREGLVRRERDPGDGRAVRLHATTKGRRLIERGRERRLALLESLLGDLSAREVEVVREAAEIVDRLMLRLE
jgi:DNA-binding MarR family transcriptional regulator